jgi:predicted DNA-binding transcriptional regulator AlpA
MKTLNLTQLSQYLGIKRRTLYYMIEDGRFPVNPILHSDPRRWNIEDVDAWRGVKHVTDSGVSR